MVGLAAHWMVGSIFSAGMGWAIIPTSPDAWRTFLAVASLPAWCAAVGTWFMPESPRFLLVQGYTEAAEQVGVLVFHLWMMGLDFRVVGAQGRRNMLPAPTLVLTASSVPSQSQELCTYLVCLLVCLQVLQRMSAINKNSRSRPIRLLPHKSHHLPLVAPAADSNGDSSNSSSGHSRDSMAWQHAHGHLSQHQSNTPVDQQSNLGEAGGVHRLRASSASSRQPTGLQSAAGGSGRHRRPSQQGWKQQHRQCCRSSFNAAKLLLQQPLRRRFLPLLVAWLGLCGGWYSTVRSSVWLVGWLVGCCCLSSAAASKPPACVSDPPDTCTQGF
jgi:hypothetical protein